MTKYRFKKIGLRERAWCGAPPHGHYIEKGSVVTRIRVSDSSGTVTKYICRKHKKFLADTKKLYKSLGDEVILEK